MSELKPCPFCGEPNPCVWLGSTDRGDGTWRLYCESCSVGFDGGKSREGIIGAWNTRATHPRVEVDAEIVVLAAVESMEPWKPSFTQTSALIVALRRALARATGGV